MKRILTTILVAVGITGPFVTHLWAQNNALAADVPFSFIIGDRSMPAGSYHLSQANIAGSVFKLSDTRGHAAFVMLGIREDTTSRDPSLTFACYGKDRVLAKVTPANSGVAYSLGHNSLEKYRQHTLGVASMVSIKLTSR